MFPFKSHIFHYNSPLSIERLKERIDTALIVPDKWTADHSNVWRGKRIDNKITIDKWYRGWNSHMPVIKATLKPIGNDQTEIIGHYTIPQSTIISNFLILIFVLGLSIYHNKLEMFFVFASVLLIIFLGFGFLFFLWQYRRTKEAFEYLLDVKASH